MTLEEALSKPEAGMLALARPPCLCVSPVAPTHDAAFDSELSGTAGKAVSTDEPRLSLMYPLPQTDLDRLSLLPDVLLRDIVSCLPIKDAARTAVLSHRWRPLCASSSVSLVQMEAHPFFLEVRFEQDAIRYHGRGPHR